MSEQDQLKQRFARLNEQRDLHRKDDVAADVVPAKTVAPVADDEMTFAKLGLAVWHALCNAWKWFCAVQTGDGNGQAVKYCSSANNESQHEYDRRQNDEYDCPTYSHLPHNIYYRDQH